MNKIKCFRILPVLLVILFLATINTAMADDIKAMLRKLKSSDRSEMRSLTSVAAARGMQTRDDLRSEAQTESARSAIRESIQAMATEDLKTAEFEFGKVCKDVHGDWVRLEEYVVIAPDGNDKQFKLMILNERTINNVERLDYFKNLSTFSADLPKDPEEFASIAKTMWSSDTAQTNYLTKVENLAANDYGDKVEWAYDRGTPQLDSGKYKPHFKDYDYKINGNIKISYTGTADLCTDRLWSVPDPDGGAALLTSVDTDAFQIWLGENTEQISTADGGYKYETDFGDATASETYYFINDNGDITDPTATDDWNEELIFAATEFEGRTIDLVIAPDLFEQSGIGYIK